MRALIRYVERLALAYRIACLEADLETEREEFYRIAERMPHLRRQIDRAKRELAGAGGPHSQSVYQLRSR